jgi:hypothetical protein
LLGNSKESREAATLHPLHLMTPSTGRLLPTASPNPLPAPTSDLHSPVLLFATSMQQCMLFAEKSFLFNT